MSYAYAKRSHAVQLEAYKECFGVNYNYLIPCNFYGLVSEKHKNRSHYVFARNHRVLRGTLVAYSEALVRHWTDTYFLDTPCVISYTIIW